MRTIDDHDELAALCAGDTLCLWAAQGLNAGNRAWTDRDGRAVAVAGPGLSRRDRLAVRGPADAVISLVRAILPELGHTYRPLGEAALIDDLVRATPGLEPTGSFGWMDAAGPPPPHGDAARWLADPSMPEITDLLADAFPDSYAKPGIPGVERWAGIHDETDRLAAVAALAWSAPAVGLLTGVAVRPSAQGRGLGREICGFTVAAALARHGNAALMVEERNDAAIRLYRRLGMRYRPLRAAAQRATHSSGSRGATA